MSHDLATPHAVVVASSSSSPSAVSRGGNRVEGLPLTKLLDPLRWYFKWVRENPESATSLEQLSRTLTMMWSDPTNLISAEACFSLCKLHTFSNTAIITTGGRRTSTTEVLSLLLKAISEVECLGELVYRKYADHRRVWNALLVLEALKCLLRTCAHRHFILVPWMWESLKTSLRRALRCLTTLAPRRRLRRSNGVGANSGAGGDSNGCTFGGDALGSAVEGGGFVGSCDSPLAQRRFGRGGSASLRGTVVGPLNTRLIIPRVASDRRSEHRLVCSAGDSVACNAVGYDEDRVAFAGDDELDDDAYAAAEAIPITWIDLLGTMLDAYLLVRPLALVAAARHEFLALPDEAASQIAVLPPPVSREEMAAATKAATEAAEAAAKTGAVVAPTPALPDPLAALHKAIAATPQQTLFGSWRAWMAFTGCDIIVVLLARLVRARRVPVVYIKDHAQQSSDVNTIVVAGGEERPGAPNTDDTAAAAIVGNTNAHAIGPVAVPPVVSQDRLRVQQAQRNVLYNFLRDPFFTAVLKQLIDRHLHQGFVNRIPLLGVCISFYVTHYLSMQHYSFLYTLG